MKPHRTVLRFAAAAAALSFALAASANFASIGAADVKFQAIGPAGMKIDGTSEKLSASEADGKLTISASLTNLKTGIGLRDKHLRGYLKTNQHPQATLVVERSKLTVPADNQTVKGKAKGDFTLNGVTKPVEFKYQAKRTGSDYHVQGITKIDIRDFKVEVPCYLGVCVEPQVSINVKFKLRDK